MPDITEHGRAGKGRLQDKSGHGRRVYGTPGRTEQSRKGVFTAIIKKAAVNICT